MKSTSIDITGKLPKGLVEIYSDIAAHTSALGIDYLVVGAMARDLVLVHGYGSTIERGTRDIDFGINVASWEDFDALGKRILEAGYEPDSKQWHRFSCRDEEGLPWEIDILPFGAIADKDATISWPPKQESLMTVLGFAEAAENALAVTINHDPKIVIPVASPVGVSILKLVSWTERVEFKGKDASDFQYLIRSYTNIPEINDAIYQDGQMEAQAWDEGKASAMKLGQDANAVVLPKTREYLRRELFDQTDKVDQFARDMERGSNSDLAECSEWLAIFTETFLANS
ncbi:nucleotidyl transferase AbiEii/AbiGii toxin family protein [Porticoccaceae bacterium LTM1]|nr:nucleotidyl transferase AbiEii/AbiGii toxin family protein [Porticoccaceae bacterium LTM1]